jgi:hypothetical protein
MNYDEAKNMVENHGWDYFFNYFSREFPDYRLYSVSKYWFQDQKYICKFKGGKGDIIVTWEGTNDHLEVKNPDKEDQ